MRRTWYWIALLVFRRPSTINIQKDLPPCFVSYTCCTLYVASLFGSCPDDYVYPPPQLNAVYAFYILFSSKILVLQILLLL